MYEALARNKVMGEAGSTLAITGLPVQWTTNNIFEFRNHKMHLVKVYHSVFFFSIFTVLLGKHHNFRTF